MSAQSTSYRSAVPNYAMNMNMNMNTNIKNKFTNLNICSINCRSLSKPSNVSTSQSFSRYLASQQLRLDILCLQETHATTAIIQERLDIQLQAKQSIWTHHCGIVSRNSNINIESIYVSPDHRVMVCQVSHNNNLFPTFTIMNIYAPASYKLRYTFYAHLLQLDYFQSMLHNMSVPHTLNRVYPDIIVGDFNYNFNHFPSQSMLNASMQASDFLTSADNSIPLPPATANDAEVESIMPQLESVPSSLSRSQWMWHALLLHYYQEQTHQLQTDPAIPTFRRDSTLSTIDYMFVAPSLAPFVAPSNLPQFISSSWTDHALLTLGIRFASTDHGSGLWRANPALAKNQFFVDLLHSELDAFHSQLLMMPSTPSVQSSWDDIKLLTRTLAQKTGRSKAEWRERQLKRLHKKRNKLIRSYKGQPAVVERIKVVETIIGNLQEELTANKALRSGLRWMENGEKSAGLLKRLHTQRTNNTTIKKIQHPDTNELCTSPTDMQAAASRYYEVLYTPASVNQDDITFFTNQISSSDRIPSASHEALCAPISQHDLLDGTSRSPKSSSPGMDGLPYEVLAVLFSHAATLKLALQVFQDALKNGVFPRSWQETCVILLPKKGDLSSLKNWRPISLINTDAKLFTRLINHRLMVHLGSRISSHQMGFMPSRFIGEQGMIVQCMQEIATKVGSSSIALLLDQEKAYDRVHFDYLRSCMQAFNIPDPLINAAINLFSSTSISVNINGFLSPSFQQSRGLRQGDPLSPLLFNIAFDPFLRAINNTSNITGFHLSLETNQIPPLTSPPPIKVLAYADDTLVVLRDPSEFSHLQDIIQHYMSASNASLNYNKTQALSLSGRSSPSWISFLQTHGISSWHDKSALQPLIYLGYAICSSANQRAYYANSLISMLRSSCQLHSIRPLTFRGRVTVINSLLYSKLWHAIRLFTFSQAEIKQLQQLAASFINRDAKLTRFSFNTLTTPINQGGLKLLDPAIQANALQWRWLYPLLHPSQPSPSFMPSLPVLRFTLNYILSTDTYPSYHWSFLFPHCRPTISRSFGPVKNLLRSIDSLQHNFHSCYATISTCLQLPLMDLLIHQCPAGYSLSTPFSPPSTVLQHHTTLRQLKGADIFRFNTEKLALEFHHNTNTLSHRNSSTKAIALIQSKHLLLHNFVLYHFLTLVPRPTNAHQAHLNIDTNTSNLSALHSFLQAIIRNPTVTSNNRSAISFMSTKYFKTLPSSSPPPPPNSTLSSSKWKTFWKLQIPLNARNTWYRILHKKITTKKKLYLFMPSKYSDKCSLCPAHHQIETTEHFLFSCPLKHLVWTTALSLYIDPTLISCTYNQYLDLLYMTSSHTRTFSLPYSVLSVSQVFACIQQAIWNSHYRSVFDFIPFVPSHVLSSIQLALFTLHSQENIHSII